MKTPDTKHRRWFKNTLITPLLALSLAVPCISQAQSVINSATFFQPNFKATQVKPLRFLAVAPFDQAQYTFAPPTNVGNVSWSHTVTGHSQAGASIALVGSADLQLRSFAQTTGSSLIFGREISTTTSGIIGALGVDGLLNDVLGRSEEQHV